ncbi:MAG: efflux RND transporter permease subunit [Planctomycetota bacterium]
MLDKIIRFCLEQKLVVFLGVIALAAAGVMFAPFDWDIGITRAPVAVDAIPDIGENQQIVFTQWMGRSPQDVQDQITFPLTSALMGIPEVRTVRSYSFFGFSSIYIVFREDAEFYWSRSRVLEKLNSLPPGTLPDGVQPMLGPDATALGQVFWYTLEGRDGDGEPAGGWDPQELRTIQDWNVRYALQSVEGVSEVASIGGFVEEYQIDVDPDLMRHYGVTLDEVFNAVRMSNVDVGARTIEVNRVEYIIRGLGFIKDISDIENTVIEVKGDVPVYIRNVAHVSKGPALRRGALDKGGAEAVGGVVVVRYGANPLEVIKRIKRKVEQISQGLPKKTLDDGTVSSVTIVPFYDRTGLIHETLGTLERALTEEILVTIIVVIVMLMHLRSSALISGLLPLTVLMCFIGMKLFAVDANIMALSGIAIAIGTIVDMGIIVCENILRHLGESKPDENRLEVVFRATSEVGGAVLTAILTTVVSFIPVFAMTAAEGKLFKPLAYTKTFALIASVIVALTVIPPLAHILFTKKIARRSMKYITGVLVLFAAVAAGIFLAWWAGIAVGLFGLYSLAESFIPGKLRRLVPYFAVAIAALAVGVFLTNHWTPLGPEAGFARNFIFVLALIGGLLALFKIFQRLYGPMLKWCLAHKIVFLSLPALIMLFGLYVWLGPGLFLGDMPDGLKEYKGAAWESVADKSPRRYVRWMLANDWHGRGREFMPPLDEGSFLFMPTTMPHASIGEALDVLRKQDIMISGIPEVESVVGKIGRVESSLDPAPISMIETVISYKPEYAVGESGRRINFRYDDARGGFARDSDGRLIPDPDGRPYRQWRDHIKSPDDIWDEIVKAAQIPGTTSAPKLQPIAARLVMLQSGMRAPMGVKVQGPNLESIERAGLQIERLLKEVPSVEPSSVIADRIIGKPYIEIDIDREKIAREGVHVKKVQDIIEIAIGGRAITTTVEGRERFPVRVRYKRELRDAIDKLGDTLVPAADGSQIPLKQLAEIRYVRGPQVLKSEDTFLTGYVLFDKKPGFAEVDVVEESSRYLREKRESGELDLPPGVTYDFAGSYENQVHSQETLAIVLPIALFLIFIILYLNFRSVLTTGLVFSGTLVAAAGGFILIWLYAQPWFMDFSVFGREMRDLFQAHTINLSVAVWVGFIALYGIATDNGVLMATYLRQHFKDRETRSIADVREATLYAGLRRIRPALMTAATTILALIPVLTSTGRGADVMVPMAIPSFGGMLVVTITLFVVPVLYCAIEEFKLKRRLAQELSATRQV